MRLPEFHWQSVETGGTGRGVPDANYCCGGIEGWVEFKKTTGWQVGLRPEQVAWHHRRTRAGGRTFVAVRRKTTELWLVPGSEILSLEACGLREGFAWWPGGPSAWDWEAVRAMLLGKS